MPDFADMLQYYRKARGLSQRELAASLGISAAAVGMYESRKRFPTREIEENIADVFGVSLNALRGIDEEAESKYRIDISSLNATNRERLRAYYQKLIDIQNMEDDLQ